MLVVSFGSPSAISYAVTNIVRHAMTACVGPHAVFAVARVQDFKDKWTAFSPEERRAILVLSDCPHIDMIELLSSLKGPILVSCDAFDEVVRYLIRTHAMEFAPAIRFASQVVCTLESLARAPNVLCITPECYDHDLEAFAGRLISFAGMTCTDAMFGNVRAALAAGRNGDQETLRDFVDRHFRRAIDVPSKPVLTSEQETTLGVLSHHYGALIDGRPLDTMVWPTEMLLDGNRPDSFLAGRIELLGPARCIVYGPYLHVPAGQWRISIDVETRDCFSDNALRAEVVSGRILSAVTLDLPVASMFGFDLEFDIVNPLLAVELRLHLATGAIEGSLRLIEVRLSRRERA